jgi:hypothetical protein
MEELTDHDLCAGILGGCGKSAGLYQGMPSGMPQPTFLSMRFQALTFTRNGK